MLNKIVENGYATLEIDRAKHGNSLSADLVEELITGIEQVSINKSVHTLIISSKGKNFCTGFDLSDLANETDATLLHRFVRVEILLNKIWMLPIRTVAYAQGKAWGAGADILTSCDIRILNQDSTIQFPGAKFGLILGTRRLTERVGTYQARRLITEGLILSANDALSCGLVSDIIKNPDDNLFTTKYRGSVLDGDTYALVNSISRADYTKEDLADLVLSAAKPGLKMRISNYISNLKRIKK